MEDEEGGVAPEAEAAEHGEQRGGRGGAEEGGGGRGARGGGEGREPPEDRGARGGGGGGGSGGGARVRGGVVEGEVRGEGVHELLPGARRGGSGRHGGAAASVVGREWGGGVAAVVGLEALFRSLVSSRYVEEGPFCIGVRIFLQFLHTGPYFVLSACHLSLL